MFCPKCGVQVPEGSQFCGHCGASINQPAANNSTIPPPPPPAVQPTPVYAAEKHTSGLAIASLVLGILGISLVAVILGAIALNQIGKDSNLTGRGLAIAGLVLGIIGMVAGIIVVIATMYFSIWGSGFWG